jgi:hypothetical protein
MKARMQIKGGSTLCQIAGPPDAVGKALAAVEDIMVKQREMDEKREALVLKQQMAAQEAQAAALVSGVVDDDDDDVGTSGWESSVLQANPTEVTGDNGWGAAADDAGDDWGGSASAAGW